MTPPDEQLFPWPILQAMVGGTSALDLPRLNVRTIREAEGFLERYGFDWGLEADRQEVAAIRTAALQFMSDELLIDVDIAIPAELQNETNTLNLLLIASNSVGSRQQWACALLRVMHAFTHARSALDDWFGDAIRMQVLDRFSPSLSDVDGTVYLGEDEERIPLHTFSIKHRKSVSSVVMKLLHKVENVATDIFDRIGVRIVTKSRFDALLVVRFLRRSHIVAFANIKASRSRNSLIDLDWLKTTLDTVDAMVERGELAAAERLDWLRQVCEQSPHPSNTHLNPHSSQDYRALQFTCRQLIRVPGDRLGQPGQTLRFFFPYEVQVLDRESYEATRSGRASHEDYKRRQRSTVRRRILGPDICPDG